MSFKDIVRNNYQEKPKVVDTHTFDRRAEQITDYVKETLLSRSQSGQVKETGILIKQRKVETFVSFRVFHHPDEPKAPHPIGFNSYDEPIMNTWTCRSRIAAEIIGMKVTARCRREGISVRRKNKFEPGGRIEFTLYFSVDV